jgi:hypothetical protein
VSDGTGPAASGHGRHGIDRDRFPNLAAWYDWDREQHIRQAMRAGMTREQAEWHDADESREG